MTDVSQSQEPDVLLDVNELEVDKLTLEVDDLRAHVSLMAELANLLRLSVGVDATLARVKLDIEGVEANVLLKVRLEHVRAILEKALDTIAEHPEILQILSQTLSEAVRESLGEAQTTLADVLDGLQVGATVDEALREDCRRFAPPSTTFCRAEKSSAGARGPPRQRWARNPPETRQPPFPERNRSSGCPQRRPVALCRRGR